MVYPPHHDHDDAIVDHDALVVGMPSIVQMPGGAADGGAAGAATAAGAGGSAAGNGRGAAGGGGGGPAGDDAALAEADDVMADALSVPALLTTGTRAVRDLIEKTTGAAGAAAGSCAGDRGV